MNGRGIGEFTKGEPITNLDEIQVGDLLVAYSRQFESLNLIKVTGLDPTAMHRRIFSWRFANPDERGRAFGTSYESDRGATMWESEFAGDQAGNTMLTYELWKAVAPAPSDPKKAPAADQEGPLLAGL